MNNLETFTASVRRVPIPDRSPVETDRVRALAARALQGAPALTRGEVRELAKAVVEHQAFSARS